MLDAAQAQRPDDGHRDREMGHVEMTAAVVARLLEGAPATATTKGAGADSVVGAVLGGADPQQAIVAIPTVLNAVNASQPGRQLRAASVFRHHYCSILIFLLSSSV